MQLYLLRHGTAERQSAGASDRERALTEAGRAQVRQLADGIKRLGWPLERIYSSPYRRASETAELLASTLGVQASFEGLLQLGSSPEDVEELLSRADHQHVMLVGHQPDLSRLSKHLTGRRLNLPTAGLAVVEYARGQAGRGQLVSLYDPITLRYLGLEE